MRLAFVTNNAARPPEVVAAHLAELGIPAEATDVVTSAQAASHYLADRLPAQSVVLVVGTVGLDEALRERGLRPVHRDEPAVAAVVQGYSPDLDWHQLAEGAVAISRGVPWVATNLDPTVPSTRGRLPGNGSLVAALRHATGRVPVSTGKPDPAMHRESVLRSSAERPLVVGDRLDTDIEGANASGCPSLLVFTGVTDPATLIAAPPRMRPTFLAPDLRGLLRTHSAPVLDGTAAECGTWRARPGNDGELVLTHRPDADITPADDLDALRALCAAAWRPSGRSDGGPHEAPSAWRFVGDGAAARTALAELGLGGQGKDFTGA
jgi:HAD superfamily hydrolase (TIGR01450 family)